MGSITVSNLGKAYKQYPHRWSRLLEWIVPGGKPRHQLKWVLQDVSFTVQSGEAVGIVGVNGAGKSTLLKMITGTVQPTTGSVQVNGRVAALLELGMGFHPDFTGRQNVFMAGQLQGLGVEEIAALMPEIEAFADIGDYIEQPVRVYSSGMQMRLAFAVATAHRPNVLIIDEALAVGDSAFQRKCFRRIEEFRELGTTLLFVMHDVETIKRLCSRAVLLADGRMILYDLAKNVCDSYEKRLFGKEVIAVDQNESFGGFESSLKFESIEKEYGCGLASIVRPRITNSYGEEINVIPTGTPFEIRYNVQFHQAVKGVEFGMMIKSLDGACLYATNTKGQSIKRDYSSGQEVSIVFCLAGNLAPGRYYLNVGSTHMLGSEPVFLHRRMDVLQFKVNASDANFVMGFVNMFGAASVIFN
jgi:lipopolysaccharide transport system ATP-binding protein